LDALYFVKAFTYLLVVLALLYAAISDVVRYIIPNYVSVFLISLFFMSYFLFPVDTGIVDHVAAGLIVLVVGMILFRFNLFGGGDVKLWAAAALWFGWTTFDIQLAYVGILGGILGVSLYFARLIVARIYGPGTGADGPAIPRVLQVDAGVPYGIAIAFGSILALNRSPFFHDLFT
jgi:prepilin peptidase CpaA